MAELILGISASAHDSAASLVRDGVPVAAAQEERFTRVRHDKSFPANAVRYCLDELDASFRDISAVAYYEDPQLKFRRVLATMVGAAPTSVTSFRETLGGWLGADGKRRALDVVRRNLESLDRGSVPKIVARRHHESHAASAFFPGPYESAAVLCVDGVGEWATTTVWHGRGTTLDPVSEIRFPHSLGLLYSAVTYFCGFKVDSGEYKLMGLAPYGEPRYVDLMREHLIDVKPDGSFRLHMGSFEYLRGRVMTGRAFEKLFGGRRRTPEGPLTEREFDMAASVQQITEDVMLRLARTRKGTNRRV